MNRLLLLMRGNQNGKLSVIIPGLLFAILLLICHALSFPISGMAASITSVAIDPGHGGEDRGCIGLHGTMEKDINLQLAKRLADIIQERLGIETILTRRGDHDVDQVERTGIANHGRVDLFISLHANSTFLHGQSGQIMIFIASASDEEDEFTRRRPGLWDMVQARIHNESLRLANFIAEEARKSGLWRESLVKNAPILVLKGASMPAVLVEVDFLTSSQGEDRLKDRWYQDKICEVLYRAIIRYGFTQEKDPNETAW